MTSKFHLAKMEGTEIEEPKAKRSYVRKAAPINIQKPNLSSPEPTKPKLKTNVEKPVDERSKLNKIKDLILSFD